MKKVYGHTISHCTSELNLEIYENSQHSAKAEHGRSLERNTMLSNAFIESYRVRRGARGAGQ